MRLVIDIDMHGLGPVITIASKVHPLFDDESVTRAREPATCDLAEKVSWLVAVELKRMLRDL